MNAILECPENREWLANCDGLCEPVNPGGTAAYGWLVQERGKTLAQGYAVIGSGPGMTNNVAEYHALIALLRWLLQADRPENLSVTIRMDSQLVVNQVNGRWAVRSALLFPLFMEACSLIRTLREKHRVHLIWVPREENVAADTLSRKAYQEYVENHSDTRKVRAEGPPVESNGDGTFMVRSVSRPDLSYRVDPRVPFCTCPDFQHRGRRCKHLCAVETLMAHQTS